MKRLFIQTLVLLSGLFFSTSTLFAERTVSEKANAGPSVISAEATAGASMLLRPSAKATAGKPKDGSTDWKKIFTSDGTVAPPDQQTAGNILADTLKKMADPSFEFFGKGENSMSSMLASFGVEKSGLEEANKEIEDSKNIWEAFMVFAGMNFDDKAKSKQMTVDAADDVLMEFAYAKLFEPKKKVEVTEVQNIGVEKKLKFFKQTTQIKK